MLGPHNYQRLEVAVHFVPWSENILVPLTSLNRYSSRFSRFILKTWKFLFFWQSKMDDNMRSVKTRSRNAVRFCRTICAWRSEGARELPRFRMCPSSNFKFSSKNERLSLKIHTVNKEFKTNFLKAQLSKHGRQVNPQAPVAQKIADEVVFRCFQGEGVEFFLNRTWLTPLRFLMRIFWKIQI